MNETVTARFALLSKVCAILVFATGSFVLAGWFLGISEIQSVIPGFATMKANTAIGFMLAGTSLWFLIMAERTPGSIRAAQATGAAVAVIGIISGVQYTAGVNFGIDELLFPEPGVEYPGRMAPITAVCFTLAGVSLALFDTRINGRTPARHIVHFVIGPALLAVIGHLYGARSLYSVGPYASIALHTAVAFCVLGGGMLFARPSEGVMGIMGSGELGGLMLRRILPLSALTTIVVGFGILHGRRAGFFEVEFGVSAFAVANIIVLSILLFWNAWSINRISREREQALRESRINEARYRTLFERNPFPMWVYDVETHGFLAVNSAAVKKYGFTEEEFLSMRIEEIRPPEDIPALLKDLERTHADYERGEIWRHKTKAGEVFDVEIASHSLEIENRPARLVLANDITKRKQAERALAASEERYRTTLDHMQEGCQIVDRQYRYLYVNDVAARQGRATKDELVGRTMMEKYPGIDQSEMFVHLKRCMEERVPAIMENEFTYPDGSKGWFQLSMEPVPEGVFILSTDITTEKRQEQELAAYREQLEELVKQRTAQLEDVNRELEAFSYSVSHDLRAPLRHISGFVELLRKHRNLTLDDTARRYMDVIGGAAVQMGQLIDDLLVFSRMNRTDLLESRVDLGGLVQEVIRDLAGEQKDRKVDWIVGTLPEVHGDRAMLRVVVSNLLGNALKYTRPRDVAKIEVGARGDRSNTVFWVKDNGVGFDMKYSDKLFGVFQRLHSVEEFEGTGIGLATVRRIISRHGGRTWAEGAIGEGATIYCSLPAENNQ